MWQDFASESFWRLDSGDDAFARIPREARTPRERPDRTGTGGTTPTSSQYISGDPNVPDSQEFNVKITGLGSMSADLRNAFIVAANAISDFILGDVADVGSRRNATDDIWISASVIGIDGAGGVLGQAGPDAYRSGSFLPYRGTMEFDVADAGVYQAAGLFDDIVLHEMLHTLGFGTIWYQRGLVSGSSFTGAAANAAYPGGALIPLDTTGGSGTAYSHWSESSLLGANELMTGYLDGGDIYLSYTTVASLGDLGYSTVSGANYSPPAFI